MTLSESLRAKATDAEKSAHSLGIEIMQLEDGGCAVSGSAQALHAHRRAIALAAAADAVDFATGQQAAHAEART